MKRTIILVLASIGCAGEAHDVSTLREAIDQSQVSIHDMVGVAESSMLDGRAVTAELRLDGGRPLYAYGAIGGGSRHDIRIDTIDGAIVSSAVSGAGSDPCPDSISLAEAIAIAEGEVEGGSVIAAIPDDDVACAREIQVLGPDLLWEVKVGADGAVLEREESDETED